MAQPATNIRTTPTWSSPSYTPQKPTVVKSDQEAEDVNIKIGKIIFYITCALGSGFSIGLTASNALVSVSPTGRDTRPGSTLMHSALPRADHGSVYCWQRLTMKSSGSVAACSSKALSSTDPFDLRRLISRSSRWVTHHV